MNEPLTGETVTIGHMTVCLVGHLFDHYCNHLGLTIEALEYYLMTIYQHLCSTYT